MLQLQVFEVGGLNCSKWSLDLHPHQSGFKLQANLESKYRPVLTMLLPLRKQLNRDLRSGEATDCRIHQIFNAPLIIVEEFYKFRVPIAVFKYASKASVLP
jgi:hypothetical protein